MRVTNIFWDLEISVSQRALPNSAFDLLPLIIDEAGYQLFSVELLVLMLAGQIVGDLVSAIFDVVPILSLIRKI